MRDWARETTDKQCGQKNSKRCVKCFKHPVSGFCSSATNVCCLTNLREGCHRRSNTGIVECIGQTNRGDLIQIPITGLDRLDMRQPRLCVRRLMRQITVTDQYTSRDDKKRPVSYRARRSYHCGHKQYVPINQYLFAEYHNVQVRKHNSYHGKRPRGISFLLEKHYAIVTLVTLCKDPSMCGV